MIFPLILLVLSAITHLLYFGWPAQVVFDEVYFATFVGHYANHAYFFDIHPPLAKIMAFFLGDILGATYNVDLSIIGNELPANIIFIRLLPVFSGIVLPVVIYYICRYFNFSKISAFFAGALILLENSLLVQSRFILLDATLLLCGFLAILFYQMYMHRNRNIWLLSLSALCAAGAFSIKWTGLTFVFLIFLIHIYHERRLRDICRWIMVYGSIGMIVYLSTFAIHFAYLTHSGPGDAFMTDRFQKTLIGNKYENIDIQPKSFLGKTMELNLEMLNANRRLDASHQYSSEWYTWPLMLRGVFYWEQKGEVGGNSNYIYYLGNPFIYWGGACAVALLLWWVIRRKIQDKIAYLILSGYFLNWLPFMFIGRVMFLYHYETALVFSIMAGAYLLEYYVSEEYKGIVVGSILTVIFILFLYFAPFSYGTPLLEEALYTRMWLSSWR